MPYLGKKEIKKQNRELILNVVPRKPEKIRSKDLYEKLTDHEIGMSTATIVKHLSELVKRGDLKRIQIAPKEVYYQRTESAELTLKLIKLTTLWANQIEEVYSHLNDEERKTLLKLLRNVSGKVAPIYEKYAKRVSNT